MTNDVQSESKQQKKQSRKPNLSRRERIDLNKEPKSVLAGKQKTMRLTVNYQSDILFGYMQENQAIALNAYERLAGIKRMLARDAKLSTQVDSWIDTNQAIVQAQIAELNNEVEAILTGSVFQEQDIVIPESYVSTFEASHPVAHKMIATIEAVDAVLADVEKVYFAGKIDDVKYQDIRQKAMSAVRGSVDRIYKVTRAGYRKGGKYSAIEMAAWIREGNKMVFQDIPQMAAELVAERIGTGAE